ncbi:hypothetical protein GCM10011509_09660 [Ornithinimicrobium pekingense]|uniref:Peptidase C14 caspase domain-containing protein n=2 Tax=Ornithinimicrobium pekingense TaxID=384677 RepID=A0ABQ2F5A0_9MICO|nr:hypothetical protein GCM10011509_09660 [Ornithinimicrobium pekingense]
MTKRALLIGSQTFGLTGVNADVELMAESLSGRGFQVTVKLDGGATRAGILDAYEQLITDTRRGSTDPVVVYYSGHGGRDPFDDWADRQRRGEQSHLHYIVPFDMAATTESDYRGLLAQELSALQARLTERTHNVTTILDCCHSATMSRGATLTPKAAPRGFPTAGALSVLERLAPSHDGWDTSNRLAVRIVACDPTQSAYERDSVLGGRHGALTEQLVIALRDLGDRPVSWHWIGDRVRTRVSAELPMQRPEVEGPSDRVAFSLDSRPRAGAVPVSRQGAALTIEPAGLFGASQGDTYHLVEAGGATVAGATVTEVADDRAKLTTKPPLPDGVSAELIAIPVRTSSPRPVRLAVAENVAEPLAEKIAASPLLRVLDDGDQGDGKDEGEPPAVAIVGEAKLVIHDGSGLSINRDALPTDEAGQKTAIALAERVVKAERLRRLRSASADGQRDRLISIEFFQHDDTGRSPRDLAGVRLYPGDKISVAITNTTDTPVYVGLFDIELASKIVLLSRDQPSGWRLEPGETKVAGGTDGVALSWDDTVPDNEERLETLVVIAATEPQEFLLLETARDVVTRRGVPSSELESLLTEAVTGTRNWNAGSSTTGAPPRYSVDTIDFFLSQGSKIDLHEPAFAITELPPLSVRTAQPRGSIDAPSRAAVRLVALKVQNNKALFRATVRVDALVMTLQSDGQVVAQPFTFRFPGIQDGDLLPMDKLQLYLGDVNEFVDIAIWVNRDDTNGVDLAKLFEEAVNDNVTQGALTVIGGLVLAAPQVAVAIGTVAAAATVIRVGNQLVQAAVGKEIGLYRTSFLAFEDFGVGRQPAEGLRQAQGIEFAYEIVDISGDGRERQRSGGKL